MPQDDRATPGRPSRTDPYLAPDAPGATGASRPGEGDADPSRRDDRAEIGKYVSLATFPQTAEDLISVATANGAPERVTNRLRSLRPGTSFQNARELWIALGLEALDRF